MLAEAGDFARHLKELIKDITNLSNSSSSLTSTISRVLASSLPRVYEVVGAPEDAGGPLESGGSPATSGAPSPSSARASPSSGGGRSVGQGDVVARGEPMPIAVVDHEELGRISTDHGDRLEREVLTPLRAWLDAYASLKEKNREVEASRLEVDSRRRTVADLTVKEATQHARLQKSADAKQESKLEEVSGTLRHKTDKLNATTAAFQSAEEGLHHELVALVQDAVYLGQYAANALRLQGEALVAASTLVRVSGGDGVTPRASPAHAAAQGAGGGAYGGDEAKHAPQAEPSLPGTHLSDPVSYPTPPPPVSAEPSGPVHREFGGHTAGFAPADVPGAALDEGAAGEALKAAAPPVPTYEPPAGYGVVEERTPHIPGMDAVEYSVKPGHRTDAPVGNSGPATPVSEFSEVRGT